MHDLIESEHQTVKWGNLPNRCKGQNCYPSVAVIISSIKTSIMINSSNSLSRGRGTRVAGALLCVHGVVLGKELTFLYPAPLGVWLVQFTLQDSFAEAS
jgi:hypothetical protein